MQSKLFIGTMSGTSMDGLDVVLVEIADNNISTVAHHSEAIPNSLGNKLLQLCTPSDNEIELCAQADVEFAELSAIAINRLLEANNIRAIDITAIGSHGQTIRHQPNTTKPYSLQIGNPSIIAHQTKITTIADFRMADIAAGGQGAPLVPAFHQAVFSAPDKARTVVNIGGISNITILSPYRTPTVQGYDIGPGNTLLDQWVQKHKNVPFDENGHWGESGKLLPELLLRLKQDRFIRQEPPKSSGREHFNLTWLDESIAQLESYEAADIQRTLTEFTAECIADSIHQANQDTPCEVYLCGGGVRNSLLVQRISTLCPNNSIATTDSLGIAPQLVEASAFAWLASRTLAGLSGNIKEATGAKEHKILGGIFLA